MSEQAEVCYVVHAPEVGRVKIGVSGNIEHRLITLQTGSPCLLHLVRVLEGGRKTEYRLHKQFDRHRAHGEWFSDEILPELLELSVGDLYDQPVKSDMRRRHNGLKYVHPNSMAAKKWGRKMFTHYGN